MDKLSTTSLGFLALAALIAAAEVASPHAIAKRQADSSRPNRRAAALNTELDSDDADYMRASAAAVSSLNGNLPAAAGPQVDAGTRQPSRVGPRLAQVLPQARASGPLPASSAKLPASEQEPVVANNKRRRPVPSRDDSASALVHDSEASEDYDHQEDCDNDDDDYYGHTHYNPFRMASRQMRRMGDLMGNVFDRMQGMASGDFGNYPDGNYAMASSRSDSDGYSKSSSIVNNNGRTRGIVTETRNGRTKTHRIGDDGDE